MHLSRIVPMLSKKGILPVIFIFKWLYKELQPARLSMIPGTVNPGTSKAIFHSKNAIFHSKNTKKDLNISPGISP